MQKSKFLLHSRQTAAISDSRHLQTTNSFTRTQTFTWQAYALSDLRLHEIFLIIFHFEIIQDLIQHEQRLFLAIRAASCFDKGIDAGKSERFLDGGASQLVLVNEGGRLQQRRETCQWIQSFKCIY